MKGTKNMTAQEVVEGLQKILPEGMSAEARDVAKDGATVTGIMVFSQGCQEVAPTVYLERMPDMTLEQLADMLVKAAEKAPEFDLGKTLLNREYFLSNVRPVLVNKNRVNPDVVTFEFAGDVAIALEVEVGGGTTKVTSDVLNEVQVSPSCALEKAESNLKPCVTPFDLFGGSSFGLQNLIGGGKLSPDNYNHMLIVSDESLLTLSAWHGAAAILDKRATETVSRFFGNRFMVLPSSIHEVLCVPCGMMETSELREMVSIINRTDVPAQDRLSDNVFVFEDGTFRVA